MNRSLRPLRVAAVLVAGAWLHAGLAGPSAAAVVEMIAREQAPETLTTFFRATDPSPSAVVRSLGGLGINAPLAQDLQPYAAALREYVPKLSPAAPSVLPFTGRPEAAAVKLGVAEKLMALPGMDKLQGVPHPEDVREAAEMAQAKMDPVQLAHHREIMAGAEAEIGRVAAALRAGAPGVDDASAPAARNVFSDEEEFEDARKTLERDAILDDPSEWAKSVRRLSSLARRTEDSSVAESAVGELGFEGRHEIQQQRSLKASYPIAGLIEIAVEPGLAQRSARRLLLELNPGAVIQAAKAFALEPGHGADAVGGAVRLIAEVRPEILARSALRTVFAQARMSSAAYWAAGNALKTLEYE